VAVTIKDVAREARVSVASVSRALNGHSKMTEDTRERILGVVERLRYVPHPSARSLITRRTNTIGALLPDLHGEFFSELIRGIDLAARARGLHLLVSSSHGDASEVAAASRAMHGRVDGMLVMSPQVDGQFARDDLPEDLPIVLLNTPPTDAHHPTLNIDDFGGARAMVEHLIGCGYRRIAMIAGPERNFDAAERLRGFRYAMREHAPGVEPLILPGEFTEESGQAAGRRLLAASPRPEAVFAANDMMAVGCLFALNEAGVRVPQDIALAGFDDIPIARFVAPPLTTVRVRIADLGRSALERLAQRLENPEAGQEPMQTLGCEVIVRESSCTEAGRGH
jgi:LacI family transcriptional regulator, galactose operon repressor